MRVQLVAIWVAAAALLLAAGWMLRGGGTAAVAPAADGSELASLRAEMQELRRSLDAERAGRRALEDSVAELWEELAPPGDRGEGGGGDVAAAGTEPHADARAHASGADVPGFNETAMVEAGFEPEVARRFHARVDEIELDRLYLRDQATREGWLASPRFKRANAALTEELSGTRAEFGPEVYDWMLYATGHPNRVAVTEVLEGSAASDAGLEPGDLVVGYGDEQIFRVGELRRGTLAGNPGETTAVDVIHKGSAVRLNVPRGPLGIRMRATSVRPPRPR